MGHWPGPTKSARRTLCITNKWKRATIARNGSHQRALFGGFHVRAGPPDDLPAYIWSLRQDSPDATFIEITEAGVLDTVHLHYRSSKYIQQQKLNVTRSHRYEARNSCGSNFLVNAVATEQQQRAT
ncbi:hypothetical protein OH77DRAFT_1422766 [Trametes cingulata]|nr:hypothetical protein OH77DRAFT_1422766 [Trametes cingulata]